MSRIRLFILILLAVLLPLRGAMAAAMLCGDGAASNAAVVAVAHDHPEAHADHGMQGASDQAQDDAANLDSHQGAHAHGCSFCVSGGCMAAIAGAGEPLKLSDTVSSGAFPAYAAPVPAFHSGGQDRPPRIL